MREGALLFDVLSECSELVHFAIDFHYVGAGDNFGGFLAKELHRVELINNVQKLKSLSIGNMGAYDTVASDDFIKAIAEQGHLEFLVADGLCCEGLAKILSATNVGYYYPSYALYPYPLYPRCLLICTDFRT